MTTAFFDSQGLDKHLNQELFEPAMRASQLPLTAARGAGIALSTLVPDLALVAGATAAALVAAVLALLPAASWAPAMLVTHAVVMLALGLAGGSVRWLAAGAANLLLTAAAGYGLMAGQVGLAEIVIWQAVLAGVAFTGAAQVPGWRQALAGQLVWLLVLSLAV